MAVGAGRPVSLVTGATGAIGGAVSRELAGRPGSVVLFIRDRQKGEAFLRSMGSVPAEVELLVGDLSDPASVRAAVATFQARHRTLNLLVNTAAVFERERQVTPRGWEMMLATNHLGPFLLTNLLLPSLRAAAPSRIVTVSAPSTTAMHFDDLNGTTKFSAFHAFGASKAANLLMTGSLAKRLEGSGVTPISFHPGIVKSGLMRNAPAIARFVTAIFGRPPAAAGRAILRLGTDEDGRLVPGGFYTKAGVRKAPASATDPAAQERLWKVSCELVGLPGG